MIDQPTHYTIYEGGDWKPVLKSMVISNPDLISCEKQTGHVIRDDLLGYRIIHSLKWKDGSRWDSINGMTDGELPR